MYPSFVWGVFLKLNFGSKSAWVTEREPSEARFFTTAVAAHCNENGKCAVRTHPSYCYRVGQSGVSGVWSGMYADWEREVADSKERYYLYENPKHTIQYHSPVSWVVQETFALLNKDTYLLLDCAGEGTHPIPVEKMKAARWSRDIACVNISTWELEAAAVILNFTYG